MYINAVIPSGWEGLHPSEPLTKLRRRILTGVISTSLWGGAQNDLQHTPHQVSPLSTTTCCSRSSISRFIFILERVLKLDWIHLKSLFCVDLIRVSFFFWSRYYNCVPFAGCVFVGPSKICQPRVKTFEESPQEMLPQKAPQVSRIFWKSNTGCWHFGLWEFSPRIMLSKSF